jgi:hypothetical protein
MTGSTSPDFQPSSYRVPGVYGATQPRAPTTSPLRTDVAGFIGFEPRVRDSVPPSQLTGGATPTGHAFFVDVNALQVTISGQRISVPATPRFPLSQNTGSIPVPDGQTIVYALVVAARLTQAVLIAVAGTPSVSGTEQAPPDDAVAAAVKAYFKAAGDIDAVAAARPWLRLVDAAVRRSGTSVALLVIPALRVTRCDDWNDFVARFGAPIDDGTVLGRAVRAYFANGGSRCFVTTVSRPAFNDPQGIARARQEMVGIQGTGEHDATGLERLFMVEQVSFVDAPDLHARIVTSSSTVVPLPSVSQPARFRACVGPSAVAEQATLTQTLGPPLYPADLTTGDPWDDPFLGLQLRLIARCLVLPWRMLLLLSPPLTPDTGGYASPDAAAALAWRDVFNTQLNTGGLVSADPGSASYWAGCVALYFPWLVIQEVAGDPTYVMPPTPLAAGIIARRDLARGPQIAAANETLLTVVGVDRPIDDSTNAALYSPLPGSDGAQVPAINIIRPFAGYGVQVWGARTLSTDPWLRFLNVRRALSSIERQCQAALNPLVFEPNTPFLWAQVTQAVMAVLQAMFTQGGLRGDQPSDAFFIRCDNSVNTPDTIAMGQVICEVGVAVAAPGEFIVFRIGRQEGVVQVVE